MRTALQQSREAFKKALREQAIAAETARAADETESKERWQNMEREHKKENADILKEGRRVGREAGAAIGKRRASSMPPPPEASVGPEATMNNQKTRSVCSQSYVRAILFLIVVFCWGACVPF